MDLADGSYSIEVTLKGGTGRAQIVSPTQMTVRDQTPYAVITWNSAHYDYMEVAGEGYAPTLSEDSASFEIPVTAFDEEIPIQAETTAMSEPHRISYTLEFHSDTISTVQAPVPIWGIAVVVVIGAAVAVTAVRKRHA